MKHAALLFFVPLLAAGCDFRPEPEIGFDAAWACQVVRLSLRDEAVPVETGRTPESPRASDAARDAGPPCRTAPACEPGAAAQAPSRHDVTVRRGVFGRRIIHRTR